MPMIIYGMFAAGVRFITFWWEARHSHVAGLLLVREILRYFASPTSVSAF